jgi:hypothetical protein
MRRFISLLGLFFAFTASLLAQNLNPFAINAQSSAVLDFQDFENPFQSQYQPPVPNLLEARRCAVGDELECTSRELAGSDAVNCGRVHSGRSPERASDCALKAFSEKKPFLVRYDGSGWDAFDGEGALEIVGAPDGRVIEIEWHSMWLLKSPGFLNKRSCPMPTLLKAQADGQLRCAPLFANIFEELSRLEFKQAEVLGMRPDDWE